MPFDFGGKSANKSSSQSGDSWFGDDYFPGYSDSSGDEYSYSEKSSGFSNRPEFRSKSENDYFTGDTWDNDFRKNAAPKKHRLRQSSGAGFSIPWKIVIPLLIIVILIVLCAVFQNEIKQFLVTALTWVITACIILTLLKWLIRGGR